MQIVGSSLDPNIVDMIKKIPLYKLNFDIKKYIFMFQSQAPFSFKMFSWSKIINQIMSLITNSAVVPLC